MKNQFDSIIEQSQHGSFLLDEAIKKLNTKKYVHEYGLNVYNEVKTNV